MVTFPPALMKTQNLVQQDQSHIAWTHSHTRRSWLYSFAPESSSWHIYQRQSAQFLISSEVRRLTAPQIYPDTPRSTPNYQLLTRLMSQQRLLPRWCWSESPPYSLCNNYYGLDRKVYPLSGSFELQRARRIRIQWLQRLQKASMYLGCSGGRVGPSQ